MALDLDALKVELNASVWALFGVATLFFVVRLYTRIRHAAVGVQLDDWVMFVGWLFLLAASGMTSWLIVELVKPNNIRTVVVARAHHNLQSIALGVTKTSFGITLLRLMPKGWEAKLIWALMITMNLQFAIHIIATWQAICGAADEAHIGGDNCWTLEASVTFTVFSAAYSALCDFILAILPWKMIFNLQMKRSERISVALALSMGVLAGITGIMKAYTGYQLLDVFNPNYLKNQVTYWIWSMAEPNVTIISASIPVLRGFFRNARNRSRSSPGTGGAYARTTSGFYNRSTVTANRSGPKDSDNASDTSILGRVGGVVRDGGETGEGQIVWTSEVRVQYETADAKNAKDPVITEEFELGRMTPPPKMERKNSRR